ncbi:MULTISPECIES: lysophospholipid acyltransferase family protein [Bacillaceae]|uniref:lysophospholipid acyltransferase family protein n=1 Tax=Bacillaceae TaxID=186817 RepID=UPI001E4418C9|nr:MULTISPECIES: lysophospholipid acyltransferase family protein [Bacillaceae]MCE4047640.1 1-acyl-sn-glycerol-3-phosphate acyltransferase [Bacillus sp. Au-Bac7]MCM3031086.1 1-acyl-sn-glycerol-3-phosphate acyltransferase [Niallia sp. MER 6]MDL0437379.1 lysophospholipid acyltransferase family protein [Niallia sp. SS-2023]UPO86019.1 1-acyl-sn-glycerol-3-phosphate acyltransferase [Niallia sp. Man26]
MYTFTSNFANIVLKIFGRSEAINKDKLPKDTGYVVACSHIGWIDVVALGTSLLPKQIHFMAKKELFTKPNAAKFLNSINAFPVDRENPGPSSIKTPVKLLKEKKIVGIFPSGTRTSEDVPLKRGAATIANLAKVPIVPAAYSGPTDLKGLLKGNKIRVMFGDPILLQKEDGSRKDVAELTQEMTDVMASLQLQLDARGKKQ